MTTYGLTGIGCTVYADGQRIADGASGDDPLDPTVLSGLEVVWGRGTTVDQPESSTCSFEIEDPIGGQAFLDQLRVGTPIDVDARGVVFAGETNTIIDGSFEANTPTSRAWATNAQLVWSDDATDGARAIIMRRPTDATTNASTYIAPDVMQPAGGDPSAWDTIPTTQAGQVWTINISARARSGIRYNVIPYVMSGPFQGDGALVQPAFQRPGTGDWMRITATVDVTEDGQWVGVAVVGVDYDYPWRDVAGSWADQDTAWTWQNTDDIAIDDVEVLAPTDAIAADVRVYSGRVTSTELTWPDDADAPIVAVTCHDFIADLDNIDVGDDPWPAEPMASRFTRILTLTGTAITARIDPTPGAMQVSWRDVDRQGATGLLQELAASTDAVMWPVTHRLTGPYIEVEDPASRAALYVLALVDGVVEIVPSTVGGSTLTLDACDVLRDPIQWVQDVQDVATIASVTWQEQTLDEEGNQSPTEHTYTLTDDAGVTQYGSRRVSLSSQVVAEGDAAEIANRLLARLHELDWRASGVTLDDRVLLDGAETGDRAAIMPTFLALLDGTRRIGSPIQITNLPEWSPSGGVSLVYLEGGTYSFDDGAWVLELVVSRASGLGSSAAWDELDAAWTWNQFDPAISWTDLVGVDAPETI